MQDERAWWSWGLLGLLFLLTGSPGFAAPPDGACVAWRGEIDPLPTLSSPDPFAARWARQRAAELTRLATALEAEDPTEAYRIWMHTECLVQDSTLAARARRLTPAFVIARRPSPRREAPPRELARARRRSPEPPPRATAAAASSPAEARDFSRFDVRLAAAEESLRRARFREVVQTTDRLRSELDDWPAEPAVRERRVRIEVLGGSALVALGFPDRAAQSFARALEANPDLALDPATTSPKILSLLEAVRQQSRGEGRP